MNFDIFSVCFPGRFEWRGGSNDQPLRSRPIGHWRVHRHFCGSRDV